MFKILFLPIIINKLIKTASTEEARSTYKNECGPYKNEETSENPTLEECLEDSPSTGKVKCCLVTGYINLTTRTTCVNVTNTTDGRIDIIKEFNEFSTGIKVNCGQKPEFKSDCGPDNPSKRSECSSYDLKGEYDCCYVKIKSKQFTGDACRKFENIDQNDIAEAVSAAKTVGASFEVDCFDFSFLKVNFGLLIVFFGFFLF